MGIEIKPVSFETILKSQAYRVGYGLMVNDSLVVACMQDEGIRSLATNDDMFLKVKEVTVFRPSDVSI